MRLGEGSDRGKVMKCLEQRIGVGIGDVSLEARVGSFVVEAALKGTSISLLPSRSK